MTMLLTATTPFGIVMAADKRLTWTTGRLDDNHRKIVPWPSMRAAIGFAGLASIVGGFTDEIVEQVLRSQQWRTLDDFAAALGPDLRQRIPAEVHGDNRRIYVHVAGFGPPAVPPCAQFHYVRNSEWNNIIDFFKVSEDLRDTYLKKRGIVSFTDFSASNFFLVQFSGVRNFFAKRAQRNLSREVRHLHDLNDVANWARGQVRAVARDLKKAGATPVVGDDPLVYQITPDGVNEHAKNGV